MVELFREGKVWPRIYRVKNIPVFMIGIVLIATLLISPTQVFAQDEADEPLPADPDIYTFEELGYEDEILMGPYDSMRVRFSIPAAWRLISGASIQLHLKNIYPDIEAGPENNASDTVGVRLDLEYNDVVVDSILLDWVGERTLIITIPQSALTTDEERHEFYLYMDAGIDCSGDHETSVIVYSDSSFNLPHTVTEPALDLTRLPSPFYREDSFIPKDSGVTPEITGTYMVIPTDPTLEEMQAVLTASAGLARLTDGNLPLQLLAENQLTEEIRLRSHLIYIGHSASFISLQEASFPAVFDGGRYVPEGIQEGDGILMETVSPWNRAAAILLISGENGDGLIKAARAFSSGEIRIGASDDIALVSDVPGPQYAQNVATDRSMADLGYENTRLSSSVFNPTGYLEVEFSIPAGQVVSGPAYMDVFYTSSPLVDYDQSGISLLMNDVPIGGIVYDPENGDTLVEERVTIPGHLLQPGMNRLLFQANNIPWSYCSDPSEQNTWTVIYDQTTLHIPLELNNEEGSELPLLHLYHEKLTGSATLGELAFVVEPGSIEAVIAASRIAYEQGDRMIARIVELEAAYADQVPEDFRRNRDLVLVGRPAGIPMIQDLNEYLPAPFEEDSNVALESVFDVVYRLPEDVSLGYIQLLESPWNPERAVVAVLGTTEEGIGFAADALVISALRNQLSGNFAVARGTQVVSSDTRLGVGTGNISTDLVPDAVPEEVQDTSNPVSMGASVMNSRWILLAAAGASAFAAVVVVVIALRKNRS